MKKYFLFLIVLSCLVGCSVKKQEDEVEVISLPENTEETSSNKIEEVLSKLTISQKVGQLFFVCLEGDEVNQSILDFLNDTEVGNIILFKKNITSKDQLVQFNQTLSKKIVENTTVYPFISIDQEGGDVTRIQKEAVIYPSNMAVSAAQATSYPESMGESMAKELTSLGINFNFAPVVDVNSNPDNPVIKNRSYSDDPYVVAQYALGMIEGLQRGGVLSSVKHFPGHGNTQTDSHFGLPVIDKSLDELKQMELIPFQKAIDFGVDAVMMAHILFPQIEQNEIPATLSKTIIQDLLRKEMGFDGIVITDSMRMDAISKFFGEAEGSIQAINAGVDMVILGTGKISEDNLVVQKEAILAVRKAVEDGTISEDVLDEHVRRILIEKEKLGLLDQATTGEFTVYQTSQEKAEMISRKSITLMKDEISLPFDLTKKILFISTKTGMLLDEEATSLSDENTFAYLGAKVFGQDYKIIDGNPNTKQSNEILTIVDNYDLVVIASGNSTTNANQKNLIEKITEKKDVILILLNIPYDARSFPNAKTIICGYEYTPLSVKSILDSLKTGVFYGVLPVRVDGFSKD